MNKDLELNCEDCLDIRNHGMLNQKYKDLTGVACFIWGTSFGVLISIALVCII